MLRILTYNVAGARDPDRLAAELRPLDLDVVCLNEVVRRRAHGIARARGMYAVAGGRIRRRSINAVLLRARPSWTRVLPLPHPGSRGGRPAVFARADAPTSCPTHFGIPGRDRLEQGRALIGAAGELSPLVVYGDIPRT